MISSSLPEMGGTSLLVVGGLVFVGTVVAVIIGYEPIKALVLKQERMFGLVLRGKLLIDIEPRTATILTGIAMVAISLILYVMLSSIFAVLLGLVLGAAVPYLMLSLLQKRRLKRLNNQLVGGVQTLSSGVRAGLNLIQALEMVARDGPVPLKQEFSHLIREYEFGVALEEAMDNAAERIGSADYRLLFAALQTHRQRGGDLGETLDRIADSVREIQRLENRVKTLTAQGRATARWLGAMPMVVLGILYFIEADGVRMMFTTGVGKLLVFTIVILNIAGFLWIKKIVSMDI